MLLSLDTLKCNSMLIAQEKSSSLFRSHFLPCEVEMFLFSIINSSSSLWIPLHSRGIASFTATTSSIKVPFSTGKTLSLYCRLNPLCQKILVDQCPETKSAYAETRILFGVLWSKCSPLISTTKGSVLATNFFQYRRCNVT